MISESSGRPRGQSSSNLDQYLRDHHSRTGHPHVHGPDCGHVAVPHGDHLDYLHDGHLHAAHEGHWDEH